MVVLDVNMPKSCHECDRKFYSGFWCVSYKEQCNDDDFDQTTKRAKDCPIVGECESWGSQYSVMNMALTEFLDEKYKNREDKDNIFGVGISDYEFEQYIIKYLLGDDWYVVDPLGHAQVLEIALIEILEKYSKEYLKEEKECLRRKNPKPFKLCNIRKFD